MHISLCSKDFYPLIQIRTNGMSLAYEDKVAYRVKCGFPRTIDEWIANGKMRTKAPTANPHKRSPHLDYPLWQDDVECILNVICKEGLVNSVVQNPTEFTLTLHVRVPPTTNYLMHYWHSPTMVIDKYTGDFPSIHSPDWLETVQTVRQFWQSRTLMLEMMLYFVRNVILDLGRGRTPALCPLILGCLLILFGNGYFGISIPLFPRVFWVCRALLSLHFVSLILSRRIYLHTATSCHAVSPPYPSNITPACPHWTQSCTPSVKINVSLSFTRVEQGPSQSRKVPIIIRTT
ncbi:hypothetical protein BDN70DRAFT_310420 [Pholiota conissans]|uniref:Uncharacterized protein n=1 Tax=Pholiota conissans TaxID=109636 RepID=A0A9P5YTX3_9AGAR|nr:hypothetical protein BDN70DRAFT_310420 [Pholiota conissans]